MRRDRRSWWRELHSGGQERLTRGDRLRIKAFVCMLGAILLAFLFGAHFLLRMLRVEETPEPERQEEEPAPAPHIPVIRKLRNVWIMEEEEDSLLLYRDGAQERYYFADAERDRQAGEESRREQIADVVLSDGVVTEVHVKNDKVNGVVLSADENSVELEGYGRLELADDFQGYRVYNTLAMCTQNDLAFGYAFADFVMEDDKVCGILIAREEAMENIRVLIKTADYGDKFHQELVLTADTDYVLRYGSGESAAEEFHPAGDEVTVAADSAYFSEGRVAVVPSVCTGRVLLKNVSRSQGIPRYRGYLELVRAEEGFAVVNVVSLEEYLYSVVPSEMPSSYPREALRAQAVCARTYAYGHMRKAAYPAYGAHVDDSTSYQVYNNVSEQENTTTAVKETYGQLLYTDDGELAGTYYYSTSCGVGSDANVWRTEAAKEIGYLKAGAINPSSRRESEDIGLGEYLRDEEHFAEFITSVDPDDFEAEEGWYRWSYSVEKLDPEYLCEVLKKRYQANPELVLTKAKGDYVSREIRDFSKISGIEVVSRGAGGVADELVLRTDSGTYKVVTEHNIRYVLCDGQTRVKRQNGSEVKMPSLLPSGFFILETGKEKGNVVKYTLRGGGFGHGVGMSQNAAKSMAARGYTGEDILLFFYDGCILRAIY